MTTAITLPTSGGNDDVWGTMINTAITAVRDAADAAQASADTANSAVGTEASARATAITNATTAIVSTAPSGLNNLKKISDALGGDASYSTTIATALALKAPIASPTFTGPVIITTQTAGDNSTKAASTAFVTTAVANQHTADVTAFSPATLTLANAIPGTVFEVSFDGTNWKNGAGTTITARPTSRTDLVMQCVNNVNATVPAWALAGIDRLLRVG